MAYYGKGWEDTSQLTRTPLGYEDFGLVYGLNGGLTEVARSYAKDANVLPDQVASTQWSKGSIFLMFPPWSTSSSMVDNAAPSRPPRVQISAVLALCLSSQLF